MSDRPSPRITTRKKPQQARSTQLVDDILQAAAQVLAAGGAQQFTTARVAEKAGVSVGSLYQYFPNKAAILFRMQSDEWRRTGDLLRVLLEDAERPPLRRLRALVHVFIRSECEEAELRVALADAAPLYRHAPEAREVKASGGEAMQAFMRVALPYAEEAPRRQAAELISATLSLVGKEFSKAQRKPEEIEAYAVAVADMFCAYLERLQSG